MNMKIFNFILLMWSIWIVGAFKAAEKPGDDGVDDGNTNSPPYELIFDRFEVFNNTETMFKDIKVRVRKHNRTTYVLGGEFETKREFNDDFSVEFRASSESGNEFKVIHTEKAEKCCSYLIDNEVVYPELVEFSNLPKIDANMCPIAKGKWYIIDYYITDHRLPQKLPSGDKWKIDIIVLENGKVNIAISIYIIVERKKPGL